MFCRAPMSCKPVVEKRRWCSGTVTRPNEAKWKIEPRLFDFSRQAGKWCRSECSLVPPILRRLPAGNIGQARPVQYSVSLPRRSQLSPKISPPLRDDTTPRRDERRFRSFEYPPAFCGANIVAADQGHGITPEKRLNINSGLRIAHARTLEFSRSCHPAARARIRIHGY